LIIPLTALRNGTRHLFVQDEPPDAISVATSGRNVSTASRLHQRRQRSVSTALPESTETGTSAAAALPERERERKRKFSPTSSTIRKTSGYPVWPATSSRSGHAPEFHVQSTTHFHAGHGSRVHARYAATATTATDVGTGTAPDGSTTYESTFEYQRDAAID